MDVPTPQDLRERREELGLTQSALAEEAGVSQPLIARIEGDDVDPRLSTLRSIVEALEEAEGGVTRASDVMHEGIVSVAPDDAVSEAVDRMKSEAYSQLPVLENDSPKGSISYTDIAQMRDSDDPVGELPVEKVMSEPFPNISPEGSIREVLNYLNYSKAVIVTEEGEAVGIITEANIASEML